MREEQNSTTLTVPCDFIALDLETTGLNPKYEKIIEIGAVRVENGREIKRYQRMVNPRMRLGEKIIQLTGITDNMVENAPDMVDILPEFLDFCGQLPILGHHVIFDYSFVKRAAVNAGVIFEPQGIDTLGLCRRFMPEKEKKNLQNACEFFEIVREGAHRALGDALDAWHLYQCLANLYGNVHREQFLPKPLVYKVKKEQPASKKQKEDLRYLTKYHKIDLPVQIEYLSRNEASRLKDKIIAQYGRI